MKRRSVLYVVLTIVFTIFSTLKVPAARALSVADVGPFSSASQIPTSEPHQGSSVTYNGYIYYIGGYSSQYGSLTSVYMAHLGSNGAVGSWSTTSALPNAVFNSSAAVYNGYVYLVGGNANGSNGSSSTVYYAAIQSDGTLDNWQTTTSLPQQSVAAVTLVNNGYIYSVAGDDTTAGLLKKVYFAPLNQNGTVGSWASTSDLPDYLFEGSAVIYNGYLYAMGGLGSGFDPSSSVYYAPIAQDGSVSNWQTASHALPSAVVSGGAVIHDNYVYVVGGGNSFASPSDNIYYAPIAQDGSVGLWQTATNKLLHAVYDNSVVVNNGYLYSVDGHTESGGGENVQFSAFISATTADTDNDGVLDTVENAGPNNGDADNNGTPDAEQKSVTSFINPISGNYVTLQTEDCAIGGSETTNSESSVLPGPSVQKDSSFRYPAGVMGFNVRVASSSSCCPCVNDSSLSYDVVPLCCPCGPGDQSHAANPTIKVTQMWYGNYNAKDFIARKYNSVTNTYSTIPGAEVTDVTIGDQKAIKVVYKVTDNGPLDEDLTANTIKDPSGPAVSKGSLASTGESVKLFAALGFGLVVLAGGLVFVQRRSTKK